MAHMATTWHMESEGPGVLEDRNVSEVSVLCQNAMGIVRHRPPGCQAHSNRIQKAKNGHCFPGR